jgi:tRNA(Ile)-lysidine synthase
LEDVSPEHSASTGRNSANVRPVSALPLSELFARHVDETGFLAEARTLLVAHSGGGDSTALLVLVSEWAEPRGVAVVSAHVAHGLRGAAGDEDARFCARMAASLSLPFAFRPVDVPTGRKKGESVEAAARRIRYAALLALSRDLDGAPVLTGHTRDDQAETVLLHLERKLGRGRGGIRARRGDGVVRPLLPFSRAELRGFLAERGISFREDETNENDRFARNRIRRKVLPEMERRDPGRSMRLARAGEAVTRRLDTLDTKLDEAMAKEKISLNGTWPRSFFVRLSPEEAGRLLVRAAGAKAGGKVPGRAQLKKILSRLAKGDRTFGESFAGGRIEVDPRRVRFVPGLR